METGKRFESLHSNVRVDVQSGDSSRGISDVRAGLADICMASRALNKQQIIDFYTGKIVNWKEADGNDAPITVINKAEGHSTLELFLHYFGLKNTDIKPQVIIGDIQQGNKRVAGNPDTIGHVSVGTTEYEASQGAPIKLLPLEGNAASVENMRNLSFPLSRPLNLATREEPAGFAKAFGEFAGSPQVNNLIKAQYFVPVTH